MNKDKAAPIIPTKGDPLWTVVLSQLRTEALCLAPYLLASQGLELNGAAKSKQLRQKYEHFLSLIEDSYDLSRYVFLNRSSIRTVSLAQLIEDAIENYQRRFAEGLPNNTIVLFDPLLPATKASPQVMLRIVDCILRAAQRMAASEDGAKIVFRRIPSKQSTATLFGLSIECQNFLFPVAPEKIEETLARVRQGNNAHSVHDLGLDLSAAIHLSSQLGGTVELMRGSATEQVILRFSLDLERTSGDGCEPLFASEICLYSNSRGRHQHFQEIAEFHKLELKAVALSQEIPEESCLVIDCSDATSCEEVKRNLERLPKGAIFIVPAESLDFRELLKYQGFRRVISYPLLSTKLLRLYNKKGVSGAELKAVESIAPIPLRVLVVDDTETARIVVREYLESLGHKVVEAADGSEFIDLIQGGERFDLAFCDITMMHMDGLTALKVLREYEKIVGGHLPVALMTSYSAVDGDNGGQAVDCEFYLNKPLSPEDIDRVVLNVISTRGTER